MKVYTYFVSFTSKRLIRLYNLNFVATRIRVVWLFLREGLMAYQE